MYLVQLMNNVYLLFLPELSYIQLKQVLNMCVCVLFSEHGCSTLEVGRVCVSPVNSVASGNASVGLMPVERSQKSKEELRELWRKAILQQILLQRMERENQKLQGE